MMSNDGFLLVWWAFLACVVLIMCIVGGVV